MLKHATIFVLLIATGSPVVIAGEPVEAIHDAHIHYNKDVWEHLPPAQALRMLNNENIKRALVFATPGEGAELLYRENPEIVVPLLQPYKSWRHRYVWYKDPDLKSYLLEQLQRIPYRGFGEFHVNGQDAKAQAIADMIEIARERKLVLHAHADLEAMQILLNKTSDMVVIWAHGGFDIPLETLQALFDKYPGLHVELSFREGMLDYAQQLTPEWKTLLTSYHTRFMVGADTYLPSRWAELSDLTSESRHWLQQLPDEVAADIARNNLDRLFPK
ncbi:MAG TPA: hypothetical protein VIQ03_12030 [Gammaproteobacteria bacterium]